MWSILALGAIERLIHHVINLDAITRIQLNELQGKMLRVVIASPQLSVDVFFDQAKVRLEPTVTGHSETASIFEQRPFDQTQSHTPAFQRFQCLKWERR
jgi:ubiquinone biosynthesis protein UbiJ